MNKPIDKNWNFIDAINASREAYKGYGLMASQSRMNYIRAWGCTVGKVQAIRSMEQALSSYTPEDIAEAIGVKVPSVRKLKKYFADIPENENLAQSMFLDKMIKNTKIKLEENKNVEFKEIKGKCPKGAIKNTVDEYVVAALNSESCSIFWGIKNDRTIVGFEATDSVRDEIRQNIWSKLLNIQPKIDPTAFTVHFHQVYDKEGMELINVYVLEVVSPKVDTNILYFTGGNEAFVKIDGVKKKLSGPEIQDWILRRIRRE